MIRRRPWQALGTYAMLVGALYALATRAPYRPPLVIEPSALDGLIPFVPSAAWIYVTYALLLPALIVLGRHRQHFGDVLAIVMGCGLANAIVYNVVPTSIAQRTAAPDGSLLALVQRFDTELAAIPSGHVALPATIALAAALVALRRGSKAFRFWLGTAALFGLWTAAIAASTLLTKQHVAVDVLAGLLFAAPMASFGAWVLGSGARRSQRAVSARPALHVPAVIALVVEWGVMISAVAVALRWWTGPVIIGAALVIATRQHAILILYHDGVHGLVARRRRLNDFVVNCAAGVPLLAPIHLYRALHLSHHADLGAASDPERVLLYHGEPWAFRPLPARALLRQLVGDVLAWHGIALVIRYVRERRTHRLLTLPRSRAYPELTLQLTLFVAGIAASFALWPASTTRVALLWFGTYLTVTQLLQKIRSFAEHAPEEIEPSLSCSWAPGIIGRLTIWPYNINYHREHHSHPKIPWDRLPAAFPSVAQRPGRDLLAHLWSGAVR